MLPSLSNRAGGFPLEKQLPAASWRLVETGTFQSQNVENQLEPHFTLLSLPALSKGPSVPYHHQEEKDRRLCWLGSDQWHRRCQGRGKYAALIFNAPFPFSPNKLSATAGKADLFCQQWKYFKCDACHWVTQNPSHKNTHCRSIQGKNLLDLISKPLGFRKSCKQRGISVRTGCRAGSGAGMRPRICPRVGVRNMVEGEKALDANSTCAPALSPALVQSLGTNGFLLKAPATFCLRLSPATSAYSTHEQAGRAGERSFWK